MHRLSQVGLALGNQLGVQLVEVVDFNFVLAEKFAV
jgi:hypothetical protein